MTVLLNRQIFNRYDRNGDSLSKPTRIIFDQRFTHLNRWTLSVKPLNAIATVPNIISSSTFTSFPNFWNCKFKVCKEQLKTMKSNDRNYYKGWNSSPLQILGPLCGGRSLEYSPRGGNSPNLLPACLKGVTKGMLLGTCGEVDSTIC